MQRIKEIIVSIFMVPELRRRILFTFGLLMVFRLGFIITIPGIDRMVIKDFMSSFAEGAGKLYGFVSLFSGGAVENFSIFSLGIMPYITASIIFSLLVKVVPQLEALSKEGPSGYRKISQYTRFLALPISLLWSITAVMWLKGVEHGGRPLVESMGGLSFAITGILSLTAGALFVMWLGEQITEFGIGNGASLIIMTGIIARMPHAIVQMYQDVSSGTISSDKPILIILIYIGVIIAVVYMTQAQRRIPVQYSKHIRGRQMFGGQRHFLPLRINQAGVMPVIFASTLMAFPDMVSRVSKSDFLHTIFSRGEAGFWYSLIFVVLIYFFTYFWTALYFRPVEMSENLKEWGSFIPGIRPGYDTAIYLERIMNRIALVGATFLALVALLPNMASYGLGVDKYVTSFLGGTGILIVVGVGLDLMQKIESQLLVREYDGFLKKGRIRGRR
ncbi:MAG: preprotein translocase subunit SecY [Planctomycetota bacterium]|nr:preprotein translocase subunit SecY [Planctomycetota bacterium]MDI6787482.1 preprotein translocase subunit SecY [Planctomycetota bacterium]